MGGGARAGPGARVGTPRPRWPPLPPPGRPPAAVRVCGPGRAAAPWLWRGARGGAAERPGLGGRWGTAPPAPRGPRRPAALPAGPRAPPLPAASALPATRWGRPWGGAGQGPPRGRGGDTPQTPGAPRSPSDVLTIAGSISTNTWDAPRSLGCSHTHTASTMLRRPTDLRGIPRVPQTEISTIPRSAPTIPELSSHNPEVPPKSLGSPTKSKGALRGSHRHQTLSQLPRCPLIVTETCPQTPGAPQQSQDVPTNARGALRVHEKPLQIPGQPLCFLRCPPNLLGHSHHL